MGYFVDEPSFLPRHPPKWLFWWMVTLPSKGPSLLEGIFMDGQEVSDRVSDHTLCYFAEGMIILGRF